MPENHSVAALFRELHTGSGSVLLISPLVFKAKRHPTNEELTAFHSDLRNLMAGYLRSHGLEGSFEELNTLLEGKITEGISLVQQGLSRLCYYGIQQALSEQQEPR